MTVFANAVVALVALIHAYILVLEMFFWNKPKGMRAFEHDAHFAELTRVLAANQGLYNGFLCAGLLWGLAQGPAGWDVKVFFLLCVWVAGVYGAITFSRKTLFIQTVPATLGLVLLMWARGL